MIDSILKTIINQYDFNLVYANKLVEDLSDDQMTTTPSSGLVNHPAFTLGHLVSGSALLAEDLGAKFEMPDNWEVLFLRKGPGDPRLPDQDRSKYPSKQLLINELKHQHNKVKDLLKSVDENKLKENIKWRFDGYMPTLLDLITFMCINHEAMHLGQLAAWRRAMNLKSALAGL
ncbi:MAG: DinB family protein [Ignavibacteriaceae bacterium]|nr:DinB family protein [Ignavibacteriaceae bacterium]